MSEQAPEVRGLAPFLYMLLSAPSGIAAGFVGVTLSNTLRAHGVSVPALAGLSSLVLLPSTLRFLIGPFIDLSLTSVRWCLIWMVGIVVFLIAMALTPLTPASMPPLDGLGLCLGVAVNAKGCAIAAAMAQTSPIEHRGAIAGWNNVGNLSGAGLGGGAGLWIVGHAGGAPVAGVILAGVCALCILPIFRLRAPPLVHQTGLKAKSVEIGQVLLALLRTRAGVLVCLASVIPCALGASTGLLPAVAGDWRASSDEVALITGALSGLATAPGCILGGYLCDRFPRRIVYIWAGVACAAAQAAMALAPHTPGWFAGMALVNAFVLGIGFAGISAVIYECLGEIGAATVNATLGSVCNIPVVVMTMIVGQVQAAHGSGAMLMTEAVAGFVSIAGYAVLAYLWKPAPRSDLAAGALAEA